MSKFKASPLAGKFPDKKDALFGTSVDLPRVIEVALLTLKPNPDQPRKTFSEDSLRELADSIESKGLLQPVVVQRSGEEYVIVAGERRVRAFQLLGRETIPAIATEGNADELAIIENLQREDLHPIEEAEALARLMARHGYSQGDLAKIVGKARNTVSELLSLNRLPEDIKAACRTSDTLSKSAMIELARLESQDQQTVLFEQMQQGGGTVKAVRKARTEGTAKKKPAQVPRVLARGRVFLKALSSLGTRAVPEDAYAQLLELQKSINAAVQALAGKRRS